MNSHRFDPVSALLGLFAITVGAAVVSGAVDPISGADVGIWITLAALVVGVLMVPWGGLRDRTADALSAPAVERDRNDESTS